MASEEVPVQKKVHGEGKKEKKNLMKGLMEDLASWNGVKVLEKKRWEVNILAKLLSPQALGKCFFLKDSEQRQTLAYKDTRTTKERTLR